MRLRLATEPILGYLKEDKPALLRGIVPGGAIHSAGAKGGAMPELITKYPEVTQQVLKSAGAVCGEGVAAKILTRCPADRFCRLPGGELCVYGLDGIPHTTQITAREWADAACPGVVPPLGLAAGVGGAEWVTLGVVFVGGLVLGRCWRRLGDARRGKD